MSSEDESGSCLEERSSKESSNYSPDDKMLYGDASNSFEVQAESNLYDASADPIATEEEHKDYLQVVADKEDELAELRLRFTREHSIDLWCNCGNCSTAFIVKPEECRCCYEISQVRDKMIEEKMGDQCLTEHPGFVAGCLNPWALRLAGLSYKTKNKGCKNYTTLYRKGKKTEEFFRAVSYRQLVRLVWDYTGSSTRYPLPCAYARIRKEFPSKEYVGFEEEEDDSD